MTDEKGWIFDIRSFSVEDGPGIRTTIFFKGCPLSCWWCHNPESQKMTPERMARPGRCIRCLACIQACPENAIRLSGETLLTNDEQCTLCGACVAACVTETRQIVGKQMSVGEVLTVIDRDLPFHEESGGGVTFSGGEPLMQHAFLQELLRACREREVHTALDTSGFAPWNVIDSLRPWVNLFLYDLKVMDEDRHRQTTGVSNQLILENLRRLSQLGHAIVLRMPVIPGINDDAGNLDCTGRFLASLPHLHNLNLLPYHHIALGKYERLNKTYALQDLRPPTSERMEEIAQILRGYGLSVKIGG